MTKKIDLFKDIIPAVDTGIKELWDAIDEDQQKELKKLLFVLGRWISSPVSSDPDVHAHYILTVNEYYNKNYFKFYNHPKLLWLLLTMCANPNGKIVKREYIKLSRKAEGSSKKHKFLLDMYPSAKLDDVELLVKLLSDSDVKQLAKDLGLDNKQIKELL